MASISRSTRCRRARARPSPRRRASPTNSGCPARGHRPDARDPAGPRRPRRGGRAQAEPGPRPREHPAVARCWRPGGEDMGRFRTTRSGARRAARRLRPPGSRLRPVAPAVRRSRRSDRQVSCRLNFFPTTERRLRRALPVPLGHRAALVSQEPQGGRGAASHDLHGCRPAASRPPWPEFFGTGAGLSASVIIRWPTGASGTRPTTS
jgi:hypothetical protein